MIISRKDLKMAVHPTHLSKPSKAGKRLGANVQITLPWLPIVSILLMLGMGLLAPVSVVSAQGHYEGQRYLHDHAGIDQSLSPQAQAEPQPPSPLLYLDIWLFGGLILLVMVVVGIKYLWKALQPDNRDPAEGLQPWEDPDYDPTKDDC